MHQMLVTIGGVVALCVIIALNNYVRKRQRRARRRQRRIRNIAHAKAWDWLMKRPRHKLLTYAGTQAGTNGEGGQQPSRQNE